MKKIIVIIGILIAIGVGAIIGLLYTQIWNPSWNPFRPTPEVVLAEMALKMEGLKTVHSDAEFEIEFKNAEKLNILVKMSSDGDQTDSQNPRGKGDLDITFSLKEMNCPLKMETIAIDETSYFKITTLPDVSDVLKLYGEELEEYGMEDEESESLFSMQTMLLETIFNEIKNQWIKFDQESLKNIFEMLGQEYQAPLSKEEQKELTEKLVNLLKGKKFYQVKEELPDEKIGNQMMYHYLLTLEKEGIKGLIPDMMNTIMEYYLADETETLLEEDMKEMFEGKLPRMIDEFFDKAGEIDFEVWIGQKDKYLYRAKLIEKEIDLSELGETYDEEMVLTLGKILISGEINFSKFNQPVIIEAPQEFKTLEGIFQLIIMRIFMEAGFEAF